MNIATHAIQKKGYTIKEFCEMNLISLRTYRRWEKPDNPKHEKLNELINQLECKGS